MTRHFTIKMTKSSLKTNQRAKQDVIKAYQILSRNETKKHEKKRRHLCQSVIS